jgi:hypothetical protein
MGKDLCFKDVTADKFACAGMDDLWVAECSPEAFLSFLEHPVDWVKNLANKKGKSLKLKLTAPFSIDIRRLDPPPADSGGVSQTHVLIEGINGTPAVTVRLTQDALSHIVLGPAAAKKGGGAFSITQFNLTVANLVTYFGAQVESNNKGRGQMQMAVVSYPQYGCAYAHFQAKDVKAGMVDGYTGLDMNLTKLVTLIAAISENGRDLAVAIMEPMTKMAFPKGARAVKFTPAIKHAAGMPGPKEFTVSYVSNGKGLTCSCLSVVSTLDPTGKLAEPDYLVAKDYPTVCTSTSAKQPKKNAKSDRAVAPKGRERREPR